MFILYVCLLNIICFYFSIDVLVIDSKNKYFEIMFRILILKFILCLCMSIRYVIWRLDCFCIIFLLVLF